ncbi:MAG: hypothetical protein WA771_16090 [Chthoniobacterales bacterium]
MTRQEALQELEASRLAVARDYHQVRAAANVPARTKKAFRRHPLPWLGGAATIGWLLSGRTRKKKAVLQQRIDDHGAVVSQKTKKLGIVTILLSAVRLAIPVLRPAFTALAAKKFADLAVNLKK